LTGRDAWLTAALVDAPAIAQARRRDGCFFSAWDFHLPPEGRFKLIEFNDNGSGFLFASLINALFYDAAELGRDKGMAQVPLSRVPTRCNWSTSTGWEPCAALARATAA
jgi:hypothetical protein